MIMMEYTISLTVKFFSKVCDIKLTKQSAGDTFQYTHISQ